MKKRYFKSKVGKVAVLVMASVLFIVLSIAHSAGEQFWSIQVSSYRTIEEAREDQRRLEIRQFTQVRIEKIDDSVFAYKLLVGRFTRQEDTLPILERVKGLFPTAFRKTFIAPSLASSPPKPPSPTPKPATKKTVPPIQQSPKANLPKANLPKPSPLPVQQPQKVAVVEIVEKQATPTPISSVLSLEDMGYLKEISLPGAFPEFVFHLLNYEGLESATAEVALRFSNVLSEKSTVTVEIDDIPQFTKSIKEMGYAPLLPITIHPSKGEFTKVAIKGHLLITDNSCDDITTGNLWMVVSNKSQLRLKGNQSLPTSVSQFFKSYNNHFNVAFDPENVSFDALPLFYYLHQLNDWKGIHVGINDQPVDGGQTIRVGRFTQDIAVDKGDLLVYEKGVNLLKKPLIDMYITSALKEAKIISHSDHKKGELLFSDLGVENFTQTGVGDISLNVPLRYSHFFGIPRNLGLELIVSHTPIPQNDKAFLKVFLNGLLIQPFQLEQGGNPRPYHVKIPEELLRSYNNHLELVTSYFSNTGGCGRNTPTITVSISNASRLYFDTADRKGITSVTDVMGSLSGNVLVMMDRREMFRPGIYLMDLLGKFNKDISHIDVKPWAGKILEGYDFVLLLLHPENTTTLDIPLKLDQGRFSIVNPLTQTNALTIETPKAGSRSEVMGSEYRDGFGVLQTFDHGRSKVMLLSYYKEAMPLEFLKNVSIEDLSRFNGNVVIFNKNSASYTVGEKFRVVYQEARSVPYYWNRFRLLIVLLVGCIVIVFLYYVNKKLVRE